MSKSPYNVDQHQGRYCANLSTGQHAASARAFPQRRDAKAAVHSKDVGRYVASHPALPPGDAAVLALVLGTFYNPSGRSGRTINPDDARVLTMLGWEQGRLDAARTALQGTGEWSYVDDGISAVYEPLDRLFEAVAGSRARVSEYARVAAKWLTRYSALASVARCVAVHLVHQLPADGTAVRSQVLVLRDRQVERWGMSTADMTSVMADLEASGLMEVCRWEAGAQWRLRLTDAAWVLLTDYSRYIWLQSRATATGNGYLPGHPRESAYEAEHLGFHPNVVSDDPLHAEPPEGYGFVYRLLDPRTQEVRYIGQTHHSLARRRAEHVRTPTGLISRDWIRSLRAERLMPVIELVETVPSDRLNLDRVRRTGVLTREGEVMQEYLAAGARLVNYTIE